MSNRLYSSVYAGSPLPVDDWQDFDLAAHLVGKPSDTFYFRVQGSSMTDAGIFDGDILIADRSIEPRSNDVVIAQIGDGFTVKRFKREQGRLRLVTENGGRPRPVDLGEEVHICGVVTFAIHKP